MLSIIVGTLGLLLPSTFDVDEMRSVFRMIAQRVESVDTTFRVGVIGSLPSADIADFGRRPACDESAFEWTEVRFRIHGGQARIDRAPRNGIAQNSTWTGSAWFEWTNPVSVTAVRATPRSDMTTDCWGWFNLNDWPGVGGLGAISDVLAAARDVESQTTESQFILRFNQPNTKTRVEVIVDRTEPPRLRSITHRSGDGDANGINVVVHFQVETWEMYNGVYVPVGRLRG